MVIVALRTGKEVSLHLFSEAYLLAIGALDPERLLAT